MTPIIQHGINYLKHFLTEKKGNSQLLIAAGAILATMAIYFFVTITSISQESKERVAHLYNAYQMGISINALLKNRIFTKGHLKINYQDENGNNQFTKSEFEKYVQMDSNTIFTLAEMVHDKLILDSRDPTATRHNSSPTSYDTNNTKIKVVFDMVIDHYNENGDAIKKVVDVKYFVNLAGQTVPDSTRLSNAPYEDNEPFYYLVSYADEDAGLTHSDITLQNKGVLYEGVLDTTTFKDGPQANTVIILPGDADE